MLVAKLHWLLARDVLIRPVSGTRESNHCSHSQSCQEQSAKHTQSGNEVRAAVKNLRHFRFALVRRSALGRSATLGDPPILTGKCTPGFRRAELSNKNF